LAVARTESVVAGAIACGGGEFRCDAGLVPVTTSYGCLCLEPGQTEPEIPPEQSFPFMVEAGADRLNVMLSSRNRISSAWVPEFRLKDPGGTVVMDETSPEVVGDPLFRLLRVSSPAAGTWTLEVSAPDEDI